MEIKVSFRSYRAVRIAGLKKSIKRDHIMGWIS